MNKYFNRSLLLLGIALSMVMTMCFSACDDSSSGDDKTVPSKVVTTTEGDLRGYSGEGNTWVWLGVPYAAPPVGNLRWRAPQDPTPWTDVRNANEWGDQAAQPTAYTTYGNGGVSEDCLYLNITVPKSIDDTEYPNGLPVMVYFHGGAFGILTGNSDAFNNGKSLPQKDIILITVNHRLGAFGYLAHPWLTTESGYSGSGNYGQMDLVKALEWIQSNIASFGGNPDNVTIFGQSGGGGKVISLMMSSSASGLFDKVICESGMAAYDNVVLSHCDLVTAEAKGTDLSTRLNAIDGVTVTNITEMRAVPWETIANADMAAYGTTAWLRYTPNIDNSYLTDTIQNLITAGLANDVPFLAGANSSDLIAGADLKDGVIAQMPDRIAYNSAPQYVYLWDHVPSGWLAEGAGAYHGLELVYVFNYPNSFISHYIMGLPGLSDTDFDPALDPTQGSGYYLAILESTGYFNVPVFLMQAKTEEAALTDNVMSMWANFAKDGDPSIDGVIQWDEFDSTDYAYLEIGQGGTLTMVTSASLAEWQGKY